MLKKILLMLKCPYSENQDDYRSQSEFDCPSGPAGQNSIFPLSVRERKNQNEHTTQSPVYP
jgi:hypothetical protein